MRRLLLVLTPLACNLPGPALDASSEVASSSGDASGESTAAEPTTGLDESPVERVCRPGITPSDPFVDCVESFRPEGASFGQDRFPEVVFGPPQAGAAGIGSVDVLSLGCGGEITLYFDAPAIVDGPGADFIVFENPLPVGDSTFAEPARVLVSADGEQWHPFPCDPANDRPPVGCAGVARVFAGPDVDVDPTDPATAGGDAFDLAALGLTEARYVRLIDVGEAYYEGRTWCGGGGGGFDLDAIAVVHGGT